MPEDLFKTKLRPVAAGLNKLFSDRGQDWSVCGAKRDDVPSLNPTTGFWTDPNQTNKAPRWIVQFEQQNGAWVAKLPDHESAHRIGAYNTANRDVAGIGVLPLPAVKRNDRYSFLPGWSWLLWFAFPQPLKHGSSAQLVEGFNPAEGKLRYMEQETPYVASGLVMLLEPNVVDPGPSPLTYQEATNALALLVHVIH